jgi:DNA-binding transcriptional regulator YbjK
MTARLDPTTRKEMIYTAALKLARVKGVMALNFQSVANECSVETTAATVRHYVKKTRNMQAETVRRAARSGDPAYQAFLENAKQYGFDIDN